MTRSEGNGTVTYTFQHCWTHVTGNYTETVFHDGSRVTAIPEETESYRAMARACGYGDDLAALSREHELLHTFLAEKLRGGASHALWAVAHPDQPEAVATLWEQEEEEAMTLAFQSYLNDGPLEEPLHSLATTHTLDWSALRQEALSLLRQESTGTPSLQDYK